MIRPLRVLTLTDLFPRTTDAVNGSFVLRECLALKRARLDIRVLSPIPYSPRFLWGNPKWRNVGMSAPIHSWDGVCARYPRYLRPPRAFYRKVEPFAMFPNLCRCFVAWSREKRFDIIHAHGLLPGGMAAVLLSKTFHVPSVCHARGSDVNVYPYESKANFALTRYVIESCDVPVATSKALAEKMSRMSRIARKVRVLYKSVDTRLFSPAGDKAVLRSQLDIPSDAFVAIFVGGLARGKGIMELIEAWKEVSKRLPEALLVIIGSGPLHNALVRVGQNVDVCGTKPNTQVALWMKASDVLVLPSHNEGLPNVVLEAMACGLPVVATSVGGIPEAVVHGETGFLVAAGACPELASRILALAQNPDLRRSMGKAARRRIETVFRWENYVSGAVEVYRSAIERHKLRTRQRAPAEK